MSMQRYKEEYEEGSELLWPSEKEDKITRKFYRDLSHLSKNSSYRKNGKLSFIQKIIGYLVVKVLKLRIKNKDAF